MALISLEEFTEKTKALGYDEVSIRKWDPNQINSDTQPLERF
jgi:hypothetical protein